MHFVRPKGETQVKYMVTITETAEIEVEVEAQNSFEAQRNAVELYSAGNYEDELDKERGVETSIFGGG